MSYEVVKVDQDKALRLRTRVRRRVPYEQIIDLLVEGHEVFIPEMNRKTASYVKRVLSSMVGTAVDAIPSEMDGRTGYSFKVSIVEEYLKRFREQGLQPSSQRGA
jgi:hypothetical protein